MMESYTVKPVAKALQVLEYVAGEGRELTLTEICWKVCQPKTTVFRYLHTLCQAGLLVHDPASDRYRAGVRLWALGQMAGRRSALCEVALPVMKRLRDRFNETVNLAEIDADEIVYLEMVESRRSLRMQAKVGARDPAYCTAVGKAMLALVAPERWEDHLPSRLAARTPATVTSRRALRDQLAHARARGFAWERGENEEGACCVGAPVFAPSGRVIAGLSVSAPEGRMSAPLERQIAQALLDATGEISGKLSARPDPAG
jgi:IclR family acetate operon transcriptional repressor